MSLDDEFFKLVCMPGTIISFEMLVSDGEMQSYSIALRQSWKSPYAATRTVHY
jgi:hypothetical protein